MRCFDASLYWLRLLAVVIIFGGALSSTQAQVQPQPVPAPRIPGSPAQAPNSSDENDQDPMAHRAMVQQAQRRNELRQQDIVKDTDKLFSLAQELKTEVDKSNKNEMSVSVIKKAEEIEKLAKSVKEKMKGN
ncbi:hypothetical protein [Acidobacterium sp. S8]|uniref:hypothetical protein n=1 Tax=Acidobacterium sp. S8 TaxID=1641854 RepID=UPI00131CA50A|nr:hypothetical protein [Acidobacterium sp. S8]